jgi:hypothetical protein
MLEGRSNHRVGRSADVDRLRLVAVNDIADIQPRPSGHVRRIPSTAAVGSAQSTGRGQSIAGRPQCSRNVILGTWQWALLRIDLVCTGVCTSEK